MREVAKLIGVSQSSASVWVRDVELSLAQRRALDERGERGRDAARARRPEEMRAQRRSYQEHGRRLARERGARYAAGCMLYWAEGAKRRNSVKITNSEPELLAFFADFLRSELDVPSSAMRLSCKSFRRPRRSTRIVQTIYGSIQEYGGFDRPAWLD